MGPRCSKLHYSVYSFINLYKLRLNISVTCRIEERYGFLKKICINSIIYREHYKCAYSDGIYSYEPAYDTPAHYTSSCSEDPKFYQICGTYPDPSVSNSALLCGDYLCKQDNMLPWQPFGNEVYLGSDLKMQLLKCNGVDDCVNTRYDEESCPVSGKIITLPSSRNVSAEMVCNDKCDVFMCEDEASCNGFNYGLYCLSTIRNYYGKLFYIPASYICDKREHCINREDEKYCSQIETDKNPFHHCDKILRAHVPIFNYTRCAVVGADYYYAYCTNFLDQTNCSESARIGLTCEINQNKINIRNTKPDTKY